MLRVIKEDTCYINREYRINKKGEHVIDENKSHWTTLHIGLYRRLKFEDDSICWMYIFEKDEYSGKNHKIIDYGKNFLENLFEISEKQLLSKHISKNIKYILEK